MFPVYVQSLTSEQGVRLLFSPKYHKILRSGKRYGTMKQVRFVFYVSLICNWLSYGFKKMAENTLTSEDRAKILEMLAARESYADIAETVGCSVRNIYYYADTYRDDIKAATDEWERQFINRGLRVREKRIEELERLASLHRKQIYRPASEEIDPETKRKKIDKGGLYATEFKVGPLGEVEYQVYNAALVREYRGILKDLAEETTGRITRVAPVNPDGDAPYDGGQAISEILSALNSIAARSTEERGPEPDEGEGSGS